LPRSTSRLPADRRRERDALIDRPRVCAQALLQQINPDAAHAPVRESPLPKD
jgi:hypothetical protein